MFGWKPNSLEMTLFRAYAAEPILWKDRHFKENNQQTLNLIEEAWGRISCSLGIPLPEVKPKLQDVVNNMRAYMTNKKVHFRPGVDAWYSLWCAYEYIASYIYPLFAPTETEIPIKKDVVFSVLESRENNEIIKDITINIMDSVDEDEVQTRLVLDLTAILPQRTTPTVSNSTQTEGILQEGASSGNSIELRQLIQPPENGLDLRVVEKQMDQLCYACRKPKTNYPESEEDVWREFYDLVFVPHLSTLPLKTRMTYFTGMKAVIDRKLRHHARNISNEQLISNDSASTDDSEMHIHNLSRSIFESCTTPKPASMPFDFSIPQASLFARSTSNIAEMHFQNLSSPFSNSDTTPSVIQIENYPFPASTLMIPVTNPSEIRIPKFSVSDLPIISNHHMKNTQNYSKTYSDDMAKSNGSSIAHIHNYSKACSDIATSNGSSIAHIQNYPTACSDIVASNGSSIAHIQNYPAASSDIAASNDSSNAHIQNYPAASSDIAASNDSSNAHIQNYPAASSDIAASNDSSNAHIQNYPAASSDIAASNDSFNAHIQNYQTSPSEISVSNPSTTHMPKYSDSLETSIDNTFDMNNPNSPTLSHERSSVAFYSKSIQSYLETHPETITPNPSAMNLKKNQSHPPVKRAPLPSKRKRKISNCPSLPETSIANTSEEHISKYANSSFTGSNIDHSNFQNFLAPPNAISTSYPSTTKIQNYPTSLESLIASPSELPYSQNRNFAYTNSNSNTSETAIQNFSAALASSIASPYEMPISKIRNFAYTASNSNLFSTPIQNFPASLASSIANTSEISFSQNPNFAYTNSNSNPSATPIQNFSASLASSIANTSDMHFSQNRNFAYTNSISNPSATPIQNYTTAFAPSAATSSELHLPNYSPSTSYTSSTAPIMRGPNQPSIIRGPYQRPTRNTAPYPNVNQPDVRRLLKGVRLNRKT